MASLSPNTNSSLSHSFRCPVCGSTNIVADYARGELVCSVCGTVIGQLTDSDYVSVRLMSPAKPGERLDTSPSITDVKDLSKVVKGSFKSKMIAISTQFSVEEIASDVAYDLIVSLSDFAGRELSKSEISVVMKMAEKMIMEISKKVGTDRATAKAVRISLGKRIVQYLEKFLQTGYLSKPKPSKFSREIEDMIKKYVKDYFLSGPLIGLLADAYVFRVRESVTSDGINGFKLKNGFKWVLPYFLKAIKDYFVEERRRVSVSFMTTAYCIVPVVRLAFRTFRNISVGRVTNVARNGSMKTMAESFARHFGSLAYTPITISMINTYTVTTWAPKEIKVLRPIEVPKVKRMAVPDYPYDGIASMAIVLGIPFVNEVKVRADDLTRGAVVEVPGVAVRALMYSLGRDLRTLDIFKATIIGLHILRRAGFIDFEGAEITKNAEIVEDLATLISRTPNIVETTEIITRKTIRYSDDNKKGIFAKRVSKDELADIVFYLSK